MITLQPITRDNVWEVTKLSVAENQKDFVATNAESLIEAFATISDGEVALPKAIYDNQTLVGFIMFGYTHHPDPLDPPVAKGNYSIWRLMIDQRYQRQGLGRKVIRQALNYLQTKPSGPADYCWLSYEPENIVAKKLYASLGFIENGEKSEDEIVAVIRL